MNQPSHILKTGQKHCYNSLGEVISCKESGQDGQYQVGIGVSGRRFARVNDKVAFDRLTGLSWTVDANINVFPLSFIDALSFIKKLNREAYGGYDDWRLPNRKELRSILWFESKNPSLPPLHPFENVFHGWYWSSTTAAINTKYAWYVHLGGARMFYGRKDQEFLVWPVRGKSNVLPKTGQKNCYNENGQSISCMDTGQDGELREGIAWPEKRFVEINELVITDRLTGLNWTKNANLAMELTTWNDAFEVIKELNARKYGGISSWRLPNINELESLVDASMHSPSLKSSHLFINVKEFYWSSTTSIYDPIWSWALYMRKGATGVGMKKDRHFYVWAVS